MFSNNKLLHRIERSPRNRADNPGLEIDQHWQTVYAAVVIEIRSKTPPLSCIAHESREPVRATEIGCDEARWLQGPDLAAAPDWVRERSRSFAPGEFADEFRFVVERGF